MNQSQAPSVRLKWFGIPKLLPYLKPYRKNLIYMMLLGALGSVIDISIPLFQRYAINNYITKGVTHGILWFALLYALALSIQVLANFFCFYHSGKTEMYVGRDMKRMSFNHLQTLSFSYFSQNSVGYIHARVMSDTSRIGSLVSWTLMDGIWNLFFLLGGAVIMLSINAKLALLVLVIIPVATLLSVYFQRKLVDYNRRIRESNSRITGNFNEGITGAKTVKTLVVEEKMQGTFDADAAEMKRVSVRQAHFRASFNALISFAASCALALVLWRGGLLTASQAMEIGTLSAFMSYALNLMEPVRWLVSALSELVAAQVNIERFVSLIETKSDVSDTPEVIQKYGDTFHPKKENWESLHGDIEFDDVTFRYPDGDVDVLSHFNLKVPQGTTVAIVGETGAGKSTLVNLVCRFYEPTAGQIKIDGRDARERSQLWLHSNIGYVLQTPHLFSGTVLENLLYGNPNATMEQVEEAVKAVCADRVIARMDKGYESHVGEGGDLLSTGEKQLISFARALLADPRIFVLDEATSSVDAVTEAYLQTATKRMMEGRTSFVVAHRLSTIQSADVILVVHDGKIIEQGTHSELMEQKGAYYRLYTRQYTEEMTASLYEELGNLRTSE